MFHTIPDAVARRMRFLQGVDGRDRIDGTPRLKRLRQIPEETGRFLALLAAGAPDGQYVEVGTSGGYSAQWLVLECRALGRLLMTFEHDGDKVVLARRTFQEARVTDVVRLMHGDARAYLPRYKDRIS